MKLLTNIASRWAAVSLVRQFMILCCVIVLGGLAVLGSWVSTTIQSMVASNAAAQAALHEMEAAGAILATS